MSVFRVLTYPHILLRKQAIPVTVFSDDLEDFFEGLIATMNAMEGVGLAGNQVGIPRRVLVANVEPYLANNNEDVKPWHGTTAKLFVNEIETPLTYPLRLVNPEIVRREEEVAFPFDGCLSLPGASGRTTKRWKLVEIHAKGPKQENIRIIADGILGICLQHEIDHLDGILFVDRLIEALPPDEILEIVEEAEGEKDYRKMVKKLKPIDAQKIKWGFL